MRPFFLLRHLPLSGLLLTAVPGLTAAQADPGRQAGQRIIATSSLAAKEYAAGVVGGEVILMPEVEEARLFLLDARDAVSALPGDIQDEAAVILGGMLELVENTGDPADVSRLADSVAVFLSRHISGLGETLPDFRPNRAVGAGLFRENCAVCHGDLGRGDGPRAGEMNPAPSDLSNRGLLSDATPLDFYRKILIGIAGTEMPSHEGSFTDEELWAVAWYASELRLGEDAVSRGARIARGRAGAQGPGLPERLQSSLHDPARVATMSDGELAEAAAGYAGLTSPEDAPAVAAYLRTLPHASARVGDDAISRARVRLGRGITAAQEGDPQLAARYVFDAYVSFEAAERDLALRNGALAADLEFEFANLRSRMAAGAGATDAYYALTRLLDEAEATIAPPSSAGGLAAQSFVLLFREGVEALLIVGALAALVVRAGAPERRREILYGVIAALVASAGTAIAFETAFRMGAAQQEILEGITMLAAAGMLLFVSYWLVSKIEINHWKAFVAKQGDRALKSGSRYALAAAAFLAVYREGFETVLFYKALFITAGGTGTSAIIAGALGGAAALALLYAAITRFGYRIPIRPFFAVTSTVLMYMAFAFVGKGIAELQGGALIPTTVIEWAPRIPWMGIYPTTQTLTWQLAIIGLVAAGLIWTFLLQPRLARTGS